MTGADRMQKMLARAEAEVSSLKDEVGRLRALLGDWDEWSDCSIEIQDIDNGAWHKLTGLRNKTREALKR